MKLSRVLDRIKSYIYSNTQTDILNKIQSRTKQYLCNMMLVSLMNLDMQRKKGNELVDKVSLK